jgi:hypothetical protein
MNLRASTNSAEGPDTIYIDFDDILCETALGLAEIARRDFGWRGEFHDITSFDLGASFSLTAAQTDELMERAHEPDVLLGFREVPGAVEGVRRLADAGRPIAIVTGRPAYTRPASEEWLTRHAVPFSTLTFVDKYRRTLAAGTEGVITLDALATMEFALAIEDAPLMVEFLLRRMTMPLIVLDRPWNATAVDALGACGRRLTRCASWDAIIREALG